MTCIEWSLTDYGTIQDKYYNDCSQWEEKAREELADHHIKTGVDPATQLMRSGTPVSLKEDIEVEHLMPFMQK